MPPSSTRLFYYFMFYAIFATFSCFLPSPRRARSTRWRARCRRPPDPYAVLPECRDARCRQPPMPLFRALASAASDAERFCFARRSMRHAAAFYAMMPARRHARAMFLRRRRAAHRC